MIKELSISGVFEVIPETFLDNRGSFTEIYRQSLLGQFLAMPEWKQFNSSTSKLDTIRGLHYGMYINPHIKLVTCVKGRVLDLILDVRLGSPTFGVHEALILDSHLKNSVYIPDGFAHGFQSLEEESIVNYLVSNEYNANFEKSINPLSKCLNLPWSLKNFITSEKDRLAPDFNDVLSSKNLPIYDKNKI